MYHAFFVRVKNADGNWQWRCKKVWEHRMYFKARISEFVRGSGGVFVNVHRKPPVGKF